MASRTSVKFTEERIWDCYNTLLLSPDVERVRKLVVRHDLFRMSLEVPGDVVECGVFKGVGLMYWLKLLAIFSPGSKKRVIGFDTFRRFAGSLEKYEKKSASSYVREAAFEGVDPADLQKRAQEAGLGKRMELVEGDLIRTAKKYVKDNPGFRISLLHLDVDTYQGSKAVLEAFYPVVSRSGVVVLDEYGCRGWGESDAVDEFFADKKAVIRTLPYAAKPTAYVVKP